MGPAGRRRRAKIHDHVETVTVHEFRGSGFWIMTWGSKARVLEPESLRQEIRTEAERIAKRYEGPIVAKGAGSIEGVTVVLKRASEANLRDLLECDGLAIGSPEYFGYMAGMVNWNSDIRVKQETVLPKEIPTAGIRSFQLKVALCIWHRPVLG
ncbi:MAG: WYL domain-containing protein [Pseudomonadota bacterium]